MSFPVKAFMDRMLEHLKEKNIPVEWIVLFSDNCAVQYKSCHVFDQMSQREIPILHNYFGSNHGKGEADSAIGHLSQHVDSVVRSGVIEISDSLSLFAYCKKVLSKGEPEKGMCQHYQRHFFYVSDIDRSIKLSPQTFQGTQKFHSVWNTGEQGIVEIRESSCFCEPCYLNEPGECNLVCPFEWVNVYKSTHKVCKGIQNKLWNCVTLWYTLGKKTVDKTMWCYHYKG